jgi:hypothetical protein
LQLSILQAPLFHLVIAVAAHLPLAHRQAEFLHAQHSCTTSRVCPVAALRKFPDIRRMSLSYRAIFDFKSPFVEQTLSQLAVFRKGDFATSNKRLTHTSHK